MPRPRVAIVQPWIAHYHQAFFDQLHNELDSRGIDFVVIEDATIRAADIRGDAATIVASRPMASRKVQLGSRTLRWQNLADVFATADLVILEQALGKPAISRLFIPRRFRKPIALWGHGWIRNRETTALERAALNSATKRADWFFAYTPSAARHVIAHGMPADRVTTFMNTLDTDALATQRDSVTASEIDHFRKLHELGTGPILLFIGALEPVKRLDLVIAAAEISARSVPDMKVVIAGDGSMRDSVLNSASTREYLVPVGPLFGSDKAIAMRAASAMTVPGMVGLVAVDSLVFGRPIITTAHDFHSPEFEYLEDGRTCLVSEPNAESYAAAITRLLTDSGEVRAMQEACSSQAGTYTIANMVERVATGIQQALNVADTS